MMIPKLLLILVLLQVLVEAQSNLKRGPDLIDLPFKRPHLNPMLTTFPVSENLMTNKKRVEVITQKNIPTLSIADIEVTDKSLKNVNVRIPDDKVQESEAEKPGLTVIDTNNYTENSTPATFLMNFVSRPPIRGTFRSISTYRTNVSHFSTNSPSTIVQILNSRLSLNSTYRARQPEKLTESQTITIVTNVPNTLESGKFLSNRNKQDITISAPLSKPDKTVDAQKNHLTTNSSSINFTSEQNVKPKTYKPFTYKRSESDFTDTLTLVQPYKSKLVVNIPLKSTVRSNTSNKNQGFPLQPNLNRQPEQRTASNKQPVNTTSQAQSITKCPHRNGFFPAPNTDCGHFIMCQEGLATTISCPSGLAFNTKTSTCDWPVNVPGCNPNVFQDFTCPATIFNKFGNPSQLIQNYKYKNSCKKYIACHEGRPRLLSCDAGLYFDEKTENCVDSNLIKNCIN